MLSIHIKFMKDRFLKLIGRFELIHAGAGIELVIYLLRGNDGKFMSVL